MQFEGEEKKKSDRKKHLLGIEDLNSKRGKKKKEEGKKKKLSTESNLGPTDERTQRPPITRNLTSVRQISFPLLKPPLFRKSFSQSIPFTKCNDNP